MDSSVPLWPPLTPDQSLSSAQSSFTLYASCVEVHDAERYLTTLALR